MRLLVLTNHVWHAVQINTSIAIHIVLFVEQIYTCNDIARPCCIPGPTHLSDIGTKHCNKRYKGSMLT